VPRNLASTAAGIGSQLAIQTGPDDFPSGQPLSLWWNRQTWLFPTVCRVGESSVSAAPPNRQSTTSPALFRPGRTWHSGRQGAPLGAFLPDYRPSYRQPNLGRFFAEYRRESPPTSTSVYSAGAGSPEQGSAFDTGPGVNMPLDASFPSHFTLTAPASCFDKELTKFWRESCDLSRPTT